jgi:hypothetical protein
MHWILFVQKSWRYHEGMLWRTSFLTCIIENLVRYPMHSKVRTGCSSSRRVWRDMPFFWTLEATPKCCQLHTSLVNQFMSCCQRAAVFCILKLGMTSLTDAMLHGALHFWFFLVLSESLVYCFVLLTGTSLYCSQARLPPNNAPNEVAYVL